MFVGGQGFSGVGPSVGMGHVFVVMPDERHDFLFQVVEAGKVASSDECAAERTQPDFDLIQPRRMRRRKMKDDPFVRRSEKRSTLRAIADRRQWAFTPLGHDTAGVRTPVRVEIVTHHMDLLSRLVATAERLQALGEYLVRAVWGQPAKDLSRSHLKPGRQATSAMTNVFMFASFHARGRGRPMMRILPLQGLDAGLFVHAHHDFASFRKLLGSEVQVHDFQHLAFKLGIGTMQPVMPAMGLDRRLVQKSPDRAPTDRGYDLLGDRRLGQVRHAPVGDRSVSFARRTCGERDDLVLLVRGKKPAVGRSAVDRQVRKARLVGNAPASEGSYQYWHGAAA